MKLRFLVKSRAVFSKDLRYRYYLLRRWDLTKRLVVFLLLNPSTADAMKDDPTIRRCVVYARDWGFGGCIILNVFAFRATDPKVMKAEVDPIGRNNDRHIRRVLRMVPRVVCAWGRHGKHVERDRKILRMLRGLNGPIGALQIRCLRENDDGTPSHLLYLSKALKPIPYRSWR